MNKSRTVILALSTVACLILIGVGEFLKLDGVVVFSILGFLGFGIGVLVSAFTKDEEKD